MFAQLHPREVRRVLVVTDERTRGNERRVTGDVQGLTRTSFEPAGKFVELGRDRLAGSSVIPCPAILQEPAQVSWRRQTWTAPNGAAGSREGRETSKTRLPTSIWRPEHDSSRSSPSLQISYPLGHLAVERRYHGLPCRECRHLRIRICCWVTQLMKNSSYLRRITTTQTKRATAGASGNRNDQPLILGPPPPYQKIAQEASRYLGKIHVFSDDPALLESLWRGSHKLHIKKLRDPACND